ncbi:hypothetical protein UFOVP764_41 [uncultured Caudovirales phage]|uniref:Uncharacterized protein n=1 Tax=uncultured Caudovirales phage TaxID=2100421 RepID=A0A6J5NW20_9CAUD|nr:hypothetical protein UFOVP764_41 [uncultured Caudovirales phage]
MMNLSLVNSEVTYLLDAISLQESALVAQYERTPAPGPAETASIQRQLDMGRYLALALMHARVDHQVCVDH